MIKVLQFVPVQITVFLIFGIFVGYHSSLFENFLPVVLIGLKAIVGFDKPKIDKYLGLR